MNELLYWYVVAGLAIMAASLATPAARRLSVLTERHPRSLALFILFSLTMVFSLVWPVVLARGIYAIKKGERP